MAVFPTLSINPAVEPWEEDVASDPTIRNQVEGGYVLTRSRFTRIPDKWNIGYITLPEADKNTLRTFEKSVKVGSEKFTWTNPMNNLSYEVRFLGPIKYKPHQTKLYWDISFVLEGV